MRTATIKLNSALLFELFGLKYLDARIDSIKCLSLPGQQGIVIKLSGDDDRLMDSGDYPDISIEEKRN